MAINRKKGHSRLLNSIRISLYETNDTSSVPDAKEWAPNIFESNDANGNINSKEELFHNS